MRAIAAMVLLLTAMFAAPAHAVRPDEVLPDPALEARARHISLGLRCLVCQNQSIDDSDAPLARDLRLLVRDRLKQGGTDAEVVDYIVARYGNFVLLKPRFQTDTLLLWLATPAILLIAIALIVLAMRRRRAEVRPDAGLTTEERDALSKALKDG